jgi:hypothetical protein
MEIGATRCVYPIVMPHPKTHRTFKHIWFSNRTNPTLKNQKSLNFPNAQKKSDNNYAGQKDLTNFVIY